MQAVELRPMGIGDILDTAMRLYIRRFVPFLVIVLIAYVPYSFLDAAVTLGDDPPFGPESAPGQGGPLEGAGLGTVIGALLVFLFFALVVIPLCQGALIHNISASYLGQEIGAVESYRRAFPRLVRLWIANILVGLAVVVGIILLVVPAVIFSLWFMLTTAVVMLENQSASGSLGRSRELMRGNLGKGFLLLLAVMLLYIIYAIVVGAILGMVPWPSAFLQTFVLNLLIQMPILPLQLAAIILLYYDLRIRKEGFDMQQLAAAVETAVREEPGSRVQERP